MENLKNLKPLIIGTLIIGFFTVLFIYFYSTKYMDIKENENIKEISVNVAKSEELNTTENISIEESEPKVSVFEKDLDNKGQYTSSKKLKTTGKEFLTDEIITEIKTEISNNLYSGNISTAISKAKEVSAQYNFLENSVFETYIYEIINYFDGFDELTNTSKNSLIAKLDSPELILFVFNSLSFEGRLFIAKNKESEVFNTKMSAVGLSIISYGTQGLETCGAKNVYFVTDGFKGYHIKFAYLGNKYELYYIKDKGSNNTIIMGIDNLSGDITTINQYNEIYRS